MAFPNDKRYSPMPRAHEARCGLSSNMMLKKSASLSSSFCLFGLSGLFGCMRLTRWTRQTSEARLVSDLQAIDIFVVPKNIQIIRTRSSKR